MTSVTASGPARRIQPSRAAGRRHTTSKPTAAGGSATSVITPHPTSEPSAAAVATTASVATVSATAPAIKAIASRRATWRSSRIATSRTTVLALILGSVEDHLAVMLGVDAPGRGAFPRVGP